MMIIINLHVWKQTKRIRMGPSLLSLIPPSCMVAPNRDLANTLLHLEVGQLRSVTKNRVTAVTNDVSDRSRVHQRKDDH